MMSQIQPVREEPEALRDWPTPHPPQNYFRVMGNRPDLLSAFAPFYRALMAHGALEHRIKVLAYLAASYANECPYCVSRAHSAALEAGWSEDDLRAIQTEQDYDFRPLEHATLHIARELTRTCSLDDIAENELNLFTPAQLIELVSVVSLANFDNRFNNAFEIEAEKTRAAAK